MNDEGVFNQFINIIPIINSEKTDNKLFNEYFDSKFTFKNLDGSYLFKGEIPNSNLIAFDPSITANSEEDGCWSNCVIDTFAEGSAVFLLVCVASGPYCAAAIAIACAGYCVVS